MLSLDIPVDIHKTSYLIIFSIYMLFPNQNFRPYCWILHASDFTNISEFIYKPLNKRDECPLFSTNPNVFSKSASNFCMPILKSAPKSLRRLKNLDVLELNHTSWIKISQLCNLNSTLRVTFWGKFKAERKVQQIDIPLAKDPLK